MKIFFTKLSPTHHSIECVRNDGTREYSEVETKAFMPHDLVHFAFESEAHLCNSFWGSIAQGKTFGELNDKDTISLIFADPTSEIVQTEMITGPLHGLAKGQATPEQVYAGLQNAFSARNTPLPSYLTIEFLAAVSERLRRLIGEWNAMGKGENMEVEWAE